MVIKNKKGKRKCFSFFYSKLKKIISIRYAFLYMVAALIIICSIFLRWQNDRNYNNAIELFEAGSYEEAKESFDNLGNYKNSFSYLSECFRYTKYNEGQKLLNDNKYVEAANIFRALEDFKDSKDKVNEALYNQGVELYNDEKYEEAFKFFQDSNGYDRSNLYIANITLHLQEEMQQRIFDEAYKLFDSEKYSDALVELLKIEDYPECDKLIQECNMAIERRKLSMTVSAGLHHFVVIKEDNNGKSKIECSDSRYEFMGWDDVISVSGFGAMIIGLNKNGTVNLEGHQDKRDTEGKDIWKVDVSDWENIVQISSGQQHVVGLKEDGKVVSAGLVKGTEDWEDIRMIAAGWGHTVGLDSNGKIHYVGNISKVLKEGIEKSEGKWDDIIAIDTGGGNTDNVYGRGHIVGLRKDGTVIAVGDNDYGQCNVDGEEWKDIVAISAGDFHTVGLKSDGSVVATEIPSNAPVPAGKIDEYRSACNVDGEKWKGIVAISAGCGTTLGLNKYGKIVTAGFDTDNQTLKNDDDGEEWTNIRIYDEWYSMITDK